MVAFFHADPQNWIDAGFFKNGFVGLLRSAGILMVAYNGVDSVSTMVEETQVSGCGKGRARFRNLERGFPS